MSTTSPIYSISKELGIESNRIISACKTLGINAKGATKRLNKEEFEKLKRYFETGKNVAEEVIDINKSDAKTKIKLKKTIGKTKVAYFPNRLIGKS